MELSTGLAIGAVGILGILLIAALEEEEKKKGLDDTWERRRRLDPYQPILEIEGKEYMYRLTRNGTLQRYLKMYKDTGYVKHTFKYEIHRARTAQGSWAKDSVMFELDDVIYLGNTREGRYEKYREMYNSWVTIGDWEFKEALKTRTSNGQQLENSIR